jgi:uncharacterized protein (DUF2336 family)
MGSNPSLIAELEDAMASRSDERRNDTLRKVADLFIGNAPSYSENQVALFDDVIGRLADDTDVSAKAELSQRLASIENAPINTVKKLAADDLIDVAGPILTNSSRLNDRQLAELAASKGRHHMLAIARRQDIGEEVTDALLKRGNQQVAQAVATNATARVSEKGYETLVDLAGTDPGLAECVAQRQDIPSKHFRTLISMAPTAVQQRLAAVNPRLAERIRQAIAEANADSPQRMERDYTRAKELVAELVNANRVGDETILEFAKGGKFEETVVAIAVLVQLSIEGVNRLFTTEPVDTLLVTASAAGLTWPTVKQLLILRAGGRAVSRGDLEGAKVNFVRLKPETAKHGLQRYRVRLKQN